MHDECVVCWESVIQVGQRDRCWGVQKRANAAHSAPNRSKARIARSAQARAIFGRRQLRAQAARSLSSSSSAALRHDPSLPTHTSPEGRSEQCLDEIWLRFCGSGKPSVLVVARPSWYGAVSHSTMPSAGTAPSATSLSGMSRKQPIFACVYEVLGVEGGGWFERGGQLLLAALLPSVVDVLKSWRCCCV